eukprot:TRINITY_DN8868_c0_g3_i1.p6 TRINITY_DN8868_c0_g3~~TRINITY_DN8868_c0_g3_i1.p6  ORF type:complete len:121 (-),score=9.25 TRINITY_DN8868_c0_g3_i1:955-1317(-)
MYCVPTVTIHNIWTVAAQKILEKLKGDSETQKTCEVWKKYLQYLNIFSKLHTYLGIIKISLGTFKLYFNNAKTNKMKNKAGFKNQIVMFLFQQGERELPIFHVEVPTLLKLTVVQSTNNF